MSDDLFRAAVAHSEGLKQVAVCDAVRLYQGIADEAPALTMAVAREGNPSPSPADTDAASRQVGDILVEAADLRDQAIRQAEQQHADRVVAAARKFGISTDTRGNPDAEHAVAWLNKVAGKVSP